jgi:hypothetical protein
VLGRKLDSIPFSTHHLMIILVLGTVSFIERLRSGPWRRAAVAGRATAAPDARANPVARGRAVTPAAGTQVAGCE